MTSKRSFGLVALALVAVLAMGVVSAGASGRHDGPETLAGTWLVTIDRGPAGPLKALLTDSRGGGYVETSNAVPNTMRGPGHGVWRRTGNRRFAATGLFFRYDPQGGTFLGYLKLRSQITLSEDGDSYTTVTIAQVLDADRNPIGPPRTDSSTAERIEVEPI